MGVLKQILPVDSDDNILDNFKLIFISEGYLDTEEEKFLKDCEVSVERLFNHYPFSLTTKRQAWLSACALFKPSKNKGPLENKMPEEGRTLLRSSLNTSNDTLFIDDDLLADLIQNEVLSGLYDKRKTSEEKLKEQIGKIFDSTLFVILLPEFTKNDVGGMFQSLPAASEYYYIALTQNQNWEKFIARSIAFKVGLDIEEEAEMGNMAKSMKE